MTIVVTVETPPRGTVSQPSVQFTPAECVCTWSWGLQPATALIDWVSATVQPAIRAGAAMQIDVAGGTAAGGHTFFGICQSVVPVLGTDGFSQMQEFVDSRVLLQWDTVKALFNVRDNRIVNGQYIRRFKHILPDDFYQLRESYTNAPYTARQILDFLFNGPDIETPWTRFYHPSLDNPVYDLDFTNGRKLGQAVLEISETLGTVFTLQGGRYQLVWTVKGIGALPAFPANADHRRSGKAMSQNATRIEAQGDRNLYQVLNIDMIPDWYSSWESFWDFNLFVKDIFDHEATEAPFGTGIAAGTLYTDIDAGNDNNAGYLLARARAQTLTVEQYARLRDKRDGVGNAFRDYRKFQNRSRLQMPVALYLSNVMFKAYRFSPGFALRNTNGDSLGLTSLQIAERLLAQVTHDPITGIMVYTTGLPSQPNGYAIVQGYSVAGDAFKTLHPEYFNIDNWYSTQAVWQPLPFQIDNSGEGDQFIIFDDPVIKTADLIQMDETGKYVMLNASAVVTSPPVRVALTFAAEKFSLKEYTIDGANFGNFRDEIINVSGLSGEYVLTSTFATPFELAYADGKTARQRAVEIMNPLLNGQFFYDYGGYTVQGCNGTQLNSMIDRVTVRLNSSGGLTEDVDWTNERSRNITLGPRGQVYLTLEPDREFDRKAQLAPLLAGQAELRDQGNQLRSEAAFLLKHPKISRMLMDTFHLLMGLDSVPDIVKVKNGTGTLPAGTPLFRDGAAKNATLPNDVTPPTVTDPIFMGATPVKGEKADGPVRTTRTGQGNILFIRVKGPVALGDTVGMPAAVSAPGGQAVDYLTTAPQTSVGNCLEKWDTTDIRLAQVRVSGQGDDAWPPDNYPFTMADVKGYKKGDWVWVVSTCEAVQMGTTDPDTMTPVFSEPGAYRALRSVDPVPDGHGGFRYHIPLPQLPVPDDIKNATNYWLFISPPLAC